MVPLRGASSPVAHTDQYGIDGDVVTWEEQGTTWWTFVLVVLPDNQTPVAAVVTVRQLRGESYVCGEADPTDTCDRCGGLVIAACGARCTRCGFRDSAGCDIVATWLSGAI